MKNNRLDFWVHLSLMRACMMGFFMTLLSCDPHPGFEKVSDGIWKKLESFSDCEPDLLQADYFLMEVSFQKCNNPDSGYSFLLHHHNIRTLPASGYSADHVGLRLSSILDSMHCGDNLKLILPFSEFDNSWLSAYADSTMYQPNELMELQLHLLRTFDKAGYSKYLMQASQQGEISEEEAIELLLMNDIRMAYDKHGKCFIQHITRSQGDSILPEREISILYNTYLLDGTLLDDTTTMQFSFGRPGQIVGGLQYALSFLREGEEALIYLPSFLAFGPDGSTNHVVPARTPVYFRLKVENVRKSDEMF
jgi:FKBP-type peptidyl-prolyl cis-trans isomerase